MPRPPKDDEPTVITQILRVPHERPSGTTGSACLVVIHGPELGKRVALPRTSPIDIGRHPSNDLSLDQDSVSRRHARVLWQAESWQAIDLGSTNGTFINDVRITQCKLDDGDQLRVGRVILKFLETGSLETAYHEEIHRLMTFDALTGAHNKRFFHEAFEREVSRCVRYHRGLSLILLDIDHFKRVNDTHGHIIGDAVLRHLSAIVMEHIRRDDIFARVGGEEFAIVLPETELEDACKVAAKVRELVETTPAAVDTASFPVTVSLGVASYANGDTAESLYVRTDAALYKAKQSGRNRVCW